MMFETSSDKQMEISCHGWRAKSYLEAGPGLSGGMQVPVNMLSCQFMASKMNKFDEVL